MIRHYHVDHLGSTQAITTSNPFTAEYVRYKPYGAPSRWTSAGSRDGTSYRYEFTGYETDATSGLEYAGARHYDPALGVFLTHDPARQFASPYTYTNWDPVNRTDPNGAVIDWVVVGIVAAVLAGLAATAAGIDAYVRTGNAETAFTASSVSLAASSLGPTSYGLQLVLPSTFGKPDPRQYAISLIPIGGTVYGTVQNFKHGNYASGAVGAVAIAFEAYDTYEAYENYGPGISQQKQLDFLQSEFGQRFSTPFQRGLWSGASYLGSILGHDLAATVVGIVAKPFVFVHDLWTLGQSVWALNPGLIARNAFGTVFDAIIPTYVFYGGAGYGVDTWPGVLGRLPDPLNAVDWASYVHDVNTRNLEWVRNVWSPPIPLSSHLVPSV